MNDSAIRRLGGLVISAGSAGQLVAALLPVWRVFTSSDPSVQLKAIAKRPAAWRAQAVGFPTAFAVTGVGFAAVATGIPEPRARKMAFAAAALSALSTVLWLPITARRLAIGRRVDTLISERLNSIDIGGPTFWPYTLVTLTSILLMSVALVISGLHRRMGAIAAALSGAAILLLRVFRDWPPFLSYLITLAIGLRLAWPPRRAVPTIRP